MHEIRMEVVSDEEARELCEANNWEYVKTYIGRGINKGNVMLLAYVDDIAYTQFEEMKEQVQEERYVVRAVISTGILYISKQGITFNPAEAKKFTKEAASRKAYFMRRNGYYDWEIRRIV